MKDKHFNLLRWAPVAASMAVVLLIIVISATMINGLKKASYWRKHTFQTVLEAQTYEDSLIDAQNHFHHYLAAGTPNLLVEYQQDTNSELLDFTNLAALTHDEPEQQKRLQNLHAAVKALFDYDDRVTGIFARQGANAAFKMEENTENADLLDVTINDLEGFKDSEQKLLDKRSASEQSEYHKAAYLLIVGSGVTALLLILSNLVAGREMSRRRQAEREQRELIDRLEKALAEVKTLSGLIPICGWCKKVRTDAGYSQSVEQYVASHTGATFSHGMCPDCAGKFKADMLKANSDVDNSLPKTGRTYSK